MKEELKKELNCIRKLIKLKLVYDSNLRTKELITFNEDESIVECVRRKLVKVEANREMGEIVSYNYSLTEKGKIALTLIGESFERISR